MFKTLRRPMAALFAAALLFTLTACNSGKDDGPASQLAMTVNGHEITAGEYAASYLYSKATIEVVMYQYGIADVWNSEYADAYKVQLDEVARNQAASLYLVPDQFEAAGLSLTAEEEESVKETNSLMEEQIHSWGFTDEMATQLSRNFVMLEKLEDYYFGEGGVMAPEESEVESYFQSNYMRAKHVLISTRDENGETITDESQLAELSAKAQNVYRRAAAGEDFDALIEEFGEDPGMSANPDGYQFTDGQMVTEFQTAVENLGENEISEPVESAFGWHIIQRLPLRAEDRAEVYGEIVTGLTGMDMDRLIEQWIGEAELTTEPVLDEINFDNVEDYKYDVD